MQVSDIFDWLVDAAIGGMTVLTELANGVSNLFFTVNDNTYSLTLIGVLTIAGVGAPLAWKFIKYIVSLFSKVKPN